MGWSPYRATGLTYHRPAQSFKGYTLVTPTGGDSVFLLDMAGRVVHRWRFTDSRPGYAKLLPNGNLLLRGADPSLGPPPQARFDQPPPPFAQHIRRLGATASHVREVDWDGATVWEFTYTGIHHDVVRLPNGNTLMPLWVELAPELARRVRGGIRRRREQFPPMLGDDIIEVNSAGAIVWRVSVHDLLDPVRDPICPLETRWEWTHLNGLDVTREGNIVFSCRNNSRVGIVERATGRLLWKYGFPNVAHQHNAQALPNGNVQIFDNGMHKVSLPSSRVIEVNPKDDAIVWQYASDPPEQFFSGHVSGADRLPGGTVLICEGAGGRVFEVTPAGETVWEWVNPFANRINGRLLTLIFRAHRYAPEFTGLAGRRLDPQAHADLNRLHGLM